MSAVHIKVPIQMRKCANWQVSQIVPGNVILKILDILFVKIQPRYNLLIHLLNQKMELTFSCKWYTRSSATVEGHTEHTTAQIRTL